MGRMHPSRIYVTGRFACSYIYHPSTHYGCRHTDKMLQFVHCVSIAIVASALDWCYCSRCPYLVLHNFHHRHSFNFFNGCLTNSQFTTISIDSSLFLISVLSHIFLSLVFPNQLFFCFTFK